MKREFAKELLMEWGLPWDVYGTPPLLNEEHDSGRWHQHHNLVFMAPDDGKVWQVGYSTALTELQDMRPWDDEDAHVNTGGTITGVEVRAVEKVVTIYQPVED